MDAAAIQAKVYAGYGKAASRVGFTFAIYRPTADAQSPITPGNKIGSVPAAFTQTGSGFNFEKPGVDKNALYNGLFDATTVAVGDYLVCDGQPIYFVAQLQHIAPPLCVRCNRAVTVVAPGPAVSGFGKQAPYAGSTAANEQPEVGGWPASILLEARGRQNEVALPLDSPSPFFAILLPPTLTTDVRSGMTVRDDNGRRYLIAGSELSDYGWRLTAQQAVT